MLKRLLHYLFLQVQRLPMDSNKMRPFLVRWGGVKIEHPNKVFIGENVTFDSLNPQLIIVEDYVLITANCSFLTHYINPHNRRCSYGSIRIKRNAILGWGTIICKPVTIGENSIVGSGSIVTHDIPDNEVWAGNPAHFIRKIDPNDFYDKAKLNL